MRILVLTETIPYPLDAGGRIKTFHTLRMLRGHHEVRLHAFIRDAAQQAHQAAIEALGVPTTLHLLPRSVATEAWLAARSVAGAPYSVGRHFDRAVHAEIASVAAAWSPDLVYVDHLSMAEYGRRLPVPMVYDAHNVEHAILRRFALTRRHPLARAVATVEWRRVRTYEAMVCRASRLVCVVSDVDRRELAALAGPSTPFAVVPIAVDAGGVTPPASLSARPQVLFLGGLHWPPNADALSHFVQSAWPRVQQARPDATLVSVGRDDAPAAAECRRAPGVTLVGHVPDIAPYMRDSRVLVVPMRAGSGMRVKILEAMARGVPVVTTSVGCEGIEVVDGAHVLIADEPMGFAAAVVRLLDDPALGLRLAGAARRLVMDRYDVASVRARLLDALESARTAPS